LQVAEMQKYGSIAIATSASQGHTAIIIAPAQLPLCVFERYWLMMPYTTSMGRHAALRACARNDHSSFSFLTSQSTTRRTLTTDEPRIV